MACVFVSLDLVMLLILVGEPLSEVMGAPVQIQSTPFENAVQDEDTVVLYCKAVGVYLQWEFNGHTLGIFNGDEELGAVKQRTVNGNTVATAILLSKALNSDNITVKTSVMILNTTFIEDRPIRADCFGEGMDQASYTVTEPIMDNSQRTESTSSEATVINPTSTSAPNFSMEMSSAPCTGTSLVLLSLLVASSIFL